MKKIPKWLYVKNLALILLLLVLGGLYITFLTIKKLVFYKKNKQL